MSDGVDRAILLEKDYLLPISVYFHMGEEKGVGILVKQGVLEVCSGWFGFG